MSSPNITTAKKARATNPSSANVADNVSARRDDVAQRLALLRPSKELIEYYRKKVEDLSSDHEKLLERLNSFRSTYEDQSKMQQQLRQREEEISELQRALSDMQVYLFQEREQVLRLYSENDRLKIRELEDRKKIQQLLQLSGVTESEITYFVKEPPGKAIVKQHNPSSSKKQINPPGKFLNTNNSSSKTMEVVSGLEHETVLRECDKLRNQVESLQTQLTEQTTLAREEISTLLEDRRIRLEESDAKREKDQMEIRGGMERLKQTQELLYESTRDFLDQRLQYRKSEKEWLVEREKLLRQVEVSAAKSEGGTHQDALNTLLLSPSWQAISGASANNGEMSNEREKRYQQHINRLEEQLGQQQDLSEMYREQLINMENDVCRMREEGDVSKVIFRDRTEKISKRLALMNRRYADLEERRHLEVNGFQSDIKMLREKLRNVERQLFKVTLSLNEEVDLERPEDVDLAVLKTVHATASHSKKISNELRNLKAMMYGLESEFRRL